MILKRILAFKCWHLEILKLKTTILQTENNAAYKVIANLQFKESLRLKSELSCTVYLEHLLGFLVCRSLKLVFYQKWKNCFICSRRCIRFSAHIAHSSLRRSAMLRIFDQWKKHCSMVLNRTRLKTRFSILCQELSWRLLQKMFVLWYLFKDHFGKRDLERQNLTVPRQCNLATLLLGKQNFFSIIEISHRDFWYHLFCEALGHIENYLSEIMRKFISWLQLNSLNFQFVFDSQLSMMIERADTLDKVMESVISTCHAFPQYSFKHREPTASRDVTPVHAHHEFGAFQPDYTSSIRISETKQDANLQIISEVLLLRATVDVLKESIAIQESKINSLGMRRDGFDSKSVSTILSGAPDYQHINESLNECPKYLERNPLSCDNNLKSKLRDQSEVRNSSKVNTRLLQACILQWCVGLRCKHQQARFLLRCNCRRILKCWSIFKEHSAIWTGIAFCLEFHLRRRILRWGLNLWQRNTTVKYNMRKSEFIDICNRDLHLIFLKLLSEQCRIIMETAWNGWYCSYIDCKNSKLKGSRATARRECKLVSKSWKAFLKNFTFYSLVKRLTSVAICCQSIRDNYIRTRPIFTLWRSISKRSIDRSTPTRQFFFS